MQNTQTGIILKTATDNSSGSDVCSGGAGSKNAATLYNSSGSDADPEDEKYANEDQVPDLAFSTLGFVSGRDQPAHEVDLGLFGVEPVKIALPISTNSYYMLSVSDSGAFTLTLNRREWVGDIVPEEGGSFYVKTRKLARIVYNLSAVLEDVIHKHSEIATQLLVFYLNITRNLQEEISSFSNNLIKTRK
jgi:hypothetical protein